MNYKLESRMPGGISTAPDWGQGGWGYLRNPSDKVPPETDFIFLWSKITADGDCSHKIKKMLAPWKKSYGKPR